MSENGHGTEGGRERTDSTSSAAPQRATSDDPELRGLSTAEAEALLQEFGLNEIPEKEISTLEMILKQFTGPMPFMIEVAAVLAGTLEDWDDFGIICALLFTNAVIGFTEEYKAQGEVNALRAQLKTTASVKRDGTFVTLDSSLLVPGDVFLLKGGMVVPADCEWVEGDTLLVDTAALTGESAPRKVPSEGGDRTLLSGFVIKANECIARVVKTGLNTEMGEAAALVHAASERDTQGLFESRIMDVTECVIVVTLFVTAIIIFVQIYARGQSVNEVLLMALSLIIASVPVALPMVMQITLAIGARKMADHKAIVTHLTALQEIASMTVLCSDKTGTLTTANITVMHDQIWVMDGFSAEECLIWGAAASNRANLDDAIDSAVFRAMKSKFGDDWERQLDDYQITKFNGFNPEYKRTSSYINYRKGGKTQSLRIGKGLVDKVLSTGNDGGDMWRVENFAEIRERVKQTDVEMSLKGYKTIGVAISIDDSPMRFVGIIPMLDPPRTDSKEVIQKMYESGINVKMITGDHLNIAKETARLIGLPTNILPNTELWPASTMRDEMIEMAGGFAQVMPKDKQEVVAVLQKHGHIVGMTGDGVNDAPALKQAHIGIAVEGSTDAARGASDIILTQPGLSPIFTAVVESRRIYMRLRSYVLYRLSATVQIVSLLALLVFIYNQSISAIYIILLALLNDITMIMIAYDNVSPSRSPEKPTIFSLLNLSFFLGMAMMFLSLLFFILAHDMLGHKYKNNEGYREAVVYVQISLAIEMLIFNCREPDQWFWSSTPCLPLLLSVIFANVLVLVFAGTGVIITKVHQTDLLLIIVWDMCQLFLIDALKVGFQRLMNYSGMNAYFDSLGDNGTIEQGSFVLNRLIELAAMLGCVSGDVKIPHKDLYPHPEDIEDPEGDNETTSLLHFRFD